jgi:2-polyprenyl-3-methyl-5-hydroxy-6-metoxy-1,4-benzoquinol methylase
MDRYLESNRMVWNDWTDLHATDSEYDIAAFKAGKCTLHSIEREEFGDVAGKSLLHLQCHFGLDTLSWARRGAIVTGVDFADRAIELARRLSEETEIPARFLCAELEQIPELLQERFDIVFTSYGVLCWLPDIQSWGRTVAELLKPGGTFFIAEFHPFAYVFSDEPGHTEPTLGYRYFDQHAPMRFENTGSYASPDAPYRSVTYEWAHSLSEIVNALIAAGLRIESLHEYPYCASEMFPYQIKSEDGWWRMRDPNWSIPLTFSIRATK